MKLADNIMTRDQRQQFADRIEVLGKVKGLLMVPQLCMATTEQVAEYFDVPVETIRSTFNRNKAELEANGVVLITPAGLDSFALQNATQVAARGYRLFSVDDVVFFKPLSEDEVKQIVKILLSNLSERLADRQIELEFTDAALSFIAESGYDPVYGARPLKRYITHNVETKLARALIAGGIREKAKINVDVKAGNLVFNY